MSLADGIIVFVVSVIVGLVLWSQRRKKDEGFCAKCSYNKSCAKDDCIPTKKGRFD